MLNIKEQNIINHLPDLPIFKMGLDVYKPEDMSLTYFTLLAIENIQT